MQPSRTYSRSGQQPRRSEAGTPFEAGEVAAYSASTRPVQLFWFILLCLFAGALIGASTNAVNGWVSPLYFQNVMGWDFSGIWLASMAQGLFEGLLYGALFALVFSTAVLWITKGRSSIQLARKHLFEAVLWVYLCWTIGGLLAMALAALSPEFYQTSFIGVPRNFQKMLAYAWVGGSIWGALFGAVFGLAFGVVGIRSRWNARGRL